MLCVPSWVPGEGVVILGFAPRVSSLETTGRGEGVPEGAEVSYFRHGMVWLLEGRMEVTEGRAHEECCSQSEEDVFLLC